MVWLIAEGETPICAAARVKLRSRATALKARRSLIVCFGISESSSQVHAD
jgi:hypothetical protein